MSVDQTLRKAQSLARKGATDDAEQLLRSVLARFPNNRRALDGLKALSQPKARPGGSALTRETANALLALYQKGHLQDALAQATALAALHPGVAFPHTIAGACHAGLGAQDKAIASYRRALDLSPNSPDILNNLAAALTATGHPGDAIAHLDKALTLDPAHADALNNYANALNALDRQEEALAYLDRALAARPEFAEALNNRGNAYSHLGRLDAAAADFEAALRINPRQADAHRNLSIIKTYAPDDPQIGVMETLLASDAATDRAQVHFALAKALDDIGETDRAFAHFDAGNRLRRDAFADPMPDQKKLFAAIKEHFDKDRAVLPAEATGKRPVFILGMPRSGTSLTEQVLASHPQVHGGGELQFLRQAVRPALSGTRLDTAESAEIRERYLGALDGLGVAEPVITDKMPLNFRWIGFIAAALPEATIVHVARNPVATAWSIYRTFFPSRGLQFSFDLDAIAEYYGLYRDLMAFWRDRFGDRIHHIDYETLTENQEEETRRLLDLCGLDWDPRCLAFHETRRTVSTASAAQVRRRMYSGSSAAWRKYEKHLKPLVEALG